MIDEWSGTDWYYTKNKKDVLIELRYSINGSRLKVHLVIYL